MQLSESRLCEAQKGTRGEKLGIKPSDTFLEMRKRGAYSAASKDSCLIWNKNNPSLGHSAVYA